MIIQTRNAIKNIVIINCMSNIPHDALNKRQEAIDNYKHQETAIKTKVHKVLKKTMF